MSRAAAALKKSGPYAPAFFLAFAVAAGGLRNPADWLLFGFIFLPWAALSRPGFTFAGPAAPLLFFSWLAAAAVFSPGPAASLGVFSRYAVFSLLFFYAASSEAGRDVWLAAVLGLGAAAAALFNGLRPRPDRLHRRLILTIPPPSARRPGRRAGFVRRRREKERFFIRPSPSCWPPGSTPRCPGAPRWPPS